MESFEMFWEGRSASDRLYHITSLDKLKSICKNNRFNLSYSGVDGSEQFKFNKRPRTIKSKTPHGDTIRSSFQPYEFNFKKNYYFSVARSVYSSIFEMKDENDMREKIIIELDGSKLANRYEIIPVNYFRHGPNNHRTDEMEDRVISNKPYIENAKRYIVAIHAYIFPHNPPDFQEMELQKLKDIASMGYTVYRYKKAKDIKFLRRERAEVVSRSILNRIANTIKDTISPEEEFLTRNDTRKENNIKASYNFVSNPTYETLLELLKNEPEVQEHINLDNQTPEKLYYTVRRITAQLIRFIPDILSSARTSRNAEIRKYIYKFSEMQRKTNKTVLEISAEAYKKVLEELSKNIPNKSLRNPYSSGL
jgi:hypothetical protein